MKGIPILGSMVLLAGAIALAAPVDARKDLVDAMDKHLQERFADLEATKDGRFGVSRVETNSISKHMNLSGAPGYSSNEFASSIWIYGSKGAKLDTETMEMRYHRWGAGGRSGAKSAMSGGAWPPGKSIRNESLETAKRWVGAYRPGKSPSVVRTVDGITYEARPVRLLKAECLSCHPGMKRNDPVAVIVFGTAPFVKGN